MRPPTTNPVTQGKHGKYKLPFGVLIDGEDLSKLRDYNTWFISKRGDVYSQSWHKGKATTHKLHRVIMDAPAGKEVDHVNGNQLDNRKSNLRICSHAENGRNLKLKKNNKSGFPGVMWDKSRNKWTARIKIMYRELHLGRYEHIEEAISARLFAENYYFGDFAPEGRL